MALANEPPLLLADEPTGELDDETGAEILELLNHLNVDLGTTIVVVTHDPAISTSVGRAIAIRDGLAGDGFSLLGVGIQRCSCWSADINTRRKLGEAWPSLLSPFRPRHRQL